jgi:hypothetical protein
LPIIVAAAQGFEVAILLQLVDSGRILEIARRPGLAEQGDGPAAVGRAQDRVVPGKTKVSGTFSRLKRFLTPLFLLCFLPLFLVTPLFLGLLA